jgi:hypothetical protein
VAGSDEDRDGSRRPGAEDKEWSHRLGYRWSGDVVCGLLRVREDEERRFLG